MTRTFLFLLLIFPCMLLCAQAPTVLQTKGDSNLIPEGIAIDPLTGVTYISSINRHKIIAVASDGSTKDFIASNFDGFAEGLGIKVDERRHWLWALSATKVNGLSRAQVHAFDLQTGLTMQHYALADSVAHLFNDLVIGRDGTLFISDTYYGAIYHLDPVTNTLERFAKCPLLEYANGLAMGDWYLYIATYANGLVALDTATREVKKVTGITDTTMAAGLDGLVFSGRSLIGIYNISRDSSRNCIVRYQLSYTPDSVAAEKILDQGNPLFAEPTTAALFRNQLYVIANSHLRIFNANKTSTKGIEGRLRAPTILIYKLEN